MAASEMAPFARTGSLADVVASLSGELLTRGHEVSVVLPFYRNVKDVPGAKVRPTGVKFTLPLGEKRMGCEVFETTAPNGVQVFLLRRDEYFDRSGLYGIEGRDYQDNSERFIFFCKGVIELARRFDPVPDVVHAHDWQAALVPVLLDAARLPFKRVLTVHNLAFQGNFWSYDFGLTNLPASYFSAAGVEYYGSLNCLKGGILYADSVIFPSERATAEAKTPEFGCGLDPVIREQSLKLVGIPDGVDYSIWNPETDTSIPKNYSASKLGKKSECRSALLEELDLEPKPAGPVYSMICRLIEPKGFDILLPALDRILADDVRLVILGEGEANYQTALAIATRKHRGKLAYIKPHDNELAHRILAGSDSMLAPARIEPSGVSVMYGLRYGVLPVVRACGGLHQIIQDYDAGREVGTGFVFYNYSADALVDSTRRAREVFNDPAAWQAAMKRAMAADFSWQSSALKHEELYSRLTGATPLQ